MLPCHMVAAPIEPIKSQRKRPKTGCPTVTPEVVDRVADRMVKGMPMRYALAAEKLGLTVSLWRQQLEKRPVLLRLFEEKVSDYLGPVLDAIGKEKLRTMPASVWLLERRFPDEFAPPKNRDGGVQVNVQVNQVSGESLVRAARLVTHKPAKSIDVESVKTKTAD